MAQNKNREVFLNMLPDISAEIERQVAEAGGGGGVSDHGALTGLGDDDHAQYLLIDGTRAMTGGLEIDGDLTFSGAQAISTTTGNITLDPASGTLVIDADISLTGAYEIGNTTGALTLDPATDLVVKSGVHTVQSDSAVAYAEVFTLGLERVTYNPGEYSASIVFDRGGGGASGRIHLRTQQSSGTLATRLFISDTGNVGINDTTPLSTLDVTGDIHATQAIESDSQVITPILASNADLTIDAVGGDILTDNTLSYTGWVSRLTGAAINFATGAIDARSIYADEMQVDAFVAAVKRAEAGSWMLARSTAPLARQFVIPAIGSASTMYVQDLPGLNGMDAFETGHNVMVPVVQFGTVTEPGIPALVDSTVAFNYDETYAPIYTEDFESYLANQDPTDWYDTTDGNSMTQNDAHFKTYSGIVFGTQYGGTNFHTHYTGTGSDAYTNYRYQGKFMIGSTNVAIGFTFFSDYPNTDTYYRIRRYSGSTAFHVSNHTYPTCTGTTNSGFSPSTNIWIRFAIEVEDTGTQTDIRAKFWNDGDVEPGTWQIDCVDSNALRGTAGTFGIWSTSATDGLYVDDIEVLDLTQPVGANNVTVSQPTGVQYGDGMLAIVSSANGAAITASSDWTPSTNFSTAAIKTQLFYRTATASEPVEWTFSTSDDGGLHASVIAMRNVNADSVAMSNGSFSSTTTVTAPSGTAAADNTMRLFAAVISRDTTTSTPTGMTDVHTSQSGSGDSTHAIFYEVLPSGAFSGESLETFYTSSGNVHTLTLNQSGIVERAIIGRAWGTVERVYPPDEGPNEQAWAFTHTAGTDGNMATIDVAGLTAYPDGAVVDFGVNGDGFIEATTLDAQGSPYLRVVTRGSNPRTNRTLHTQLGNLDGIAGVGEEWGMWAGINTTTQYLIASDQQLAAHGMRVSLYTGSDEAIRLDPDVPSIAIGNPLPTGPDSAVTSQGGPGIWMGYHDGRYKMRIGGTGADGGGPRMVWDGVDLEIRSGPSLAPVIRFEDTGDSYFSGIIRLGTDGEIRQGINTLGVDFSGMRIRRESSKGTIEFYDTDEVVMQIDDTGIVFEADNGTWSEDSMRWIRSSDATTIAKMGTKVALGGPGIHPSVQGSAGTTFYIDLPARVDGTMTVTNDLFVDVDAEVGGDALVKSGLVVGLPSMPATVYNGTVVLGERGSITKTDGAGVLFVFDNAGTQELRILFDNGVVRTIATA